LGKFCRFQWSKYWRTVLKNRIPFLKTCIFFDVSLEYNISRWPIKLRLRHLTSLSSQLLLMAGGIHVQGGSDLWWYGIHSRCHKGSSSAAFSLSLSLSFDISSATECSHCVVVGNIADVSEVHIAFSFTSYTHRHFVPCTSETSGVLFMSTRCEHSGAELIFMNWFKHDNGGHWVCYILTK
jgi:hypothetical protein